MAQRSLHFGIRDDAGLRAATWKLWTETGGGKAEVYIACRSLVGTFKASLHDSGSWHIAYNQREFERDVADAIPRQKDRFIERWPRPPAIASGVTLAFRIVTLWSAVTHPIQGIRPNSIFWLPNAPKSKATEIDILFTAPATPVSGWPGSRSMGTSLIGSFPLQNGKTVWAVYWVVDMPDLSSAAKGIGTFYKGRTQADLQSGGLRARVFGTEPDGSRMINDCAVERSAANKGMEPTP